MTIPDNVVELAARAIDPEAWKMRDEDLSRRQEWDAGIKAGWGKTTFNQWANRSTRESLKLARSALEAARYGKLRDLLLAGTVSVTSFDGHCVRIDYETREDAEQMFALLSTIGASQP